jgi:maleate isomerase
MAPDGVSLHTSRVFFADLGTFADPPGPEKATELLARIALVRAPFFTDDFDQKGVAYFQERGFDVVHVSHMMPPVEVPHPNTGSVASPAEIYEWVRSHVPSSAQAVFLGGNALHAIGLIAALEEDLRRPVLTANQVSLWYALYMAGAEVMVDD